jgi:hypothetical protein
MEKGDLQAARVNDPLARLALDWFALQKDRGPASLPRLMAFLAANPDWPTRAALERRVVCDQALKVGRSLAKFSYAVETQDA